MNALHCIVALDGRQKAKIKELQACNARQLQKIKDHHCRICELEADDDYCTGCGNGFHYERSAERNTCAKCDDALCGECRHACCDCGKVFCDTFVRACRCDNWYCTDCTQKSEECRTVVCNDCRHYWEWAMAAYCDKCWALL